MVSKKISYELGTLHRYWIWSNRMKSHFEKALLAYKPFGESPLQQAFYSASIADHHIFMSYWYGSLYVVVEGWRELNLTDPKVDPLISSPHVDRLKRYRNGVFHFQRKYFDERFLEITEPPGTAHWVRDLHEALGNFFLETLPTHKNDPT